MFIRNDWYIGAWAQEVAGAKPLARTIYNDKIVLFRPSSATPRLRPRKQDAAVLVAQQATLDHYKTVPYIDIAWPKRRQAKSLTTA